MQSWKALAAVHQRLQYPELDTVMSRVKQDVVKSGKEIACSGSEEAGDNVSGVASTASHNDDCDFDHSIVYDEGDDSGEWSSNGSDFEEEYQELIQEKQKRKKVNRSDRNLKSSSEEPDKKKRKYPKFGAKCPLPVMPEAVVSSFPEAVTTLKEWVYIQAQIDDTKLRVIAIHYS